MNATSSNVLKFRPSSVWLKSQAARGKLESFLKNQGLPASSTGNPASDVDNIAEATRHLVLEGHRAYAKAAWVDARSDAYYLSLSNAACEIAQELSLQLGYESAWIVSAMLAVCALLEPVMSGDRRARLADDVVSDFRRDVSAKTAPRVSSLLAQQVGALIKGEATIKSVLALIEVELLTAELVSA